MNPAVMRFVLVVFLLAALAAAAGWLAKPVRAQASRTSNASAVGAERAAVELRQGMTPAEVQQLLGKPWRTALAGSGGGTTTPGQGTLRWSYTWVGSQVSSSSERTLNVDFTAKAAEQWIVSGWNWSTY